VQSLNEDHSSKESIVKQIQEARSKAENLNAELKNLQHEKKRES
jgi:chromosome segregation ATPase